MRVLVDGARSAAPPTNQGMFLAAVFSTLAEDSRVARPFGSAGIPAGRGPSPPGVGGAACGIALRRARGTVYDTLRFARTKRRAAACRAFQCPAEGDGRRNRHVELLVFWPAVIAFGETDLLLTQGFAVRSAGVLFVGR